MRQCLVLEHPPRRRHGRLRAVDWSDRWRPRPQGSQRGPWTAAFAPEEDPQQQSHPETGERRCRMSPPQWDVTLVEELTEMANPDNPNRAALAHLRRGLGSPLDYTLSRVGWLFRRVPDFALE